VFQSLHDLSHPGSKATAKLIAQRFVWTGVQKDCRTWARACQSLSALQILSPHSNSIGRHFLADSPFPARHVDLVGPLPLSAGSTYCLTAIDRFTCWREVISIPDITADNVARALLTGWISRVSCPQSITTNQRRQFASQLFQSLARMSGIQLSMATSHHPAANGIVELFHRTLKEDIICHADQQWTEALPLALLGISSAFKEELEASVT
jgi:transposase InsO family protein